MTINISDTNLQWNCQDQEQQGMVRRVSAMKQQNFVTPCPIIHGVFQLLATSKFLFLHGVSLKIVPVSHVDHSTPYCIHG